jgi:NAD(P)-dependent dehydrogenase (short-subunit alcohol dehydrogenase family)
MTSRFESEVIVVTGGSSGIGNAVARRVASEGASVVIGARREDVGDEAAASIRAAGIRAPADGTVAVDDGVPGGFVTAGTQLATAYDADKIFVTARVDETDIRAVRPASRST